MPEWPRLRDRLAPLMRLDGTVQFGLDPSRGLRIGGLSEPEIGWLRALDGATDPLTVGARAGLDTQRLDTLLRMLSEAGLLAGPTRPRAGLPPVRGVRSARVWIEGTAPVGERLADLLRHAGVREVSRLPGSGPIPSYRRAPDVVVLATPGPAMAPDGMRWRERGVAHLPVSHCHVGTGVGPLVPPLGGPCLECIDRARADRDPSWEWVAAQARTQADPLETSRDDAGIAIAAGLAARLVLAHLEGLPLPVGVAFEVANPWPGVRQHRWRVHPGCPLCTQDLAQQTTMGA